MPITAKLSRQFYEKLGDEVTNELVNWLNTVGLSYRQEFRELFEANSGRLEARLDSKLDRLESKLIRWMFVFWVGTIGTVIAIQRLL